MISTFDQLCVVVYVVVCSAVHKWNFSAINVHYRF